MMSKIKTFFSAAANMFRNGPDLFSIALCIAAAVVIILSVNHEFISDIGGLEAGKVADKNIIAGHSVSFVDEEATKRLIEDIEKQVPAVFTFTGGKNAYFSPELFNAYISASGFASFRGYGLQALESIHSRGVFSVNREDLKVYNSGILELLTVSESGFSREFLSYDDIITMTNLREALAVIVNNMDAPSSFKEIAVDLVKPFVSENIFFSREDSQSRVEEAREHAVPVVKNIEKGKRVIRKGFIITEEEMAELNALYYSLPGRDIRSVFGYIFLVLLMFILFIILRSPVILGRKCSNSERYLLASITGFYIIGSVLLKNFYGNIEIIPLSIFIPTSLFIMILAVFMGTRPALLMALALPLVSFFAGAFDIYSYLFALVSGVTASAIIYNTQTRMGLIRAGLVIAAANCTAVFVVLLLRAGGINDYPVMLIAAAMNGIVSAILTLGFLPPLEQALNAVTPFRLMELADLNSPILRRLFTVAPGTYSHSLMVANLAEQACLDICLQSGGRQGGSVNALLARVGAYYHDIGKMDNPDYFTENQTDHNKHDEINPRLSATIIRSHVKLGVEKARNMRLPKDIISIISEHHGNSVISWFYNKAAMKEEVNTEDFSYSGTPPHSRESAVVMLADITEAAVRSMTKPTAGKIDKFIHELFADKIDHGQLSESDLSFRDLEIIKKAFVKVLVSHYHSRIEYPNQKETE